MTETKLLPCPFCGAPAEVLEDRVMTWGLVSHRDGCLFPTYPNHQISVSDFEAWNTRATPGSDRLAFLEEKVKLQGDYIDKLHKGERELIDLAHNAWAMALCAMNGMPIPADWGNAVERGLREHGIDVDEELAAFEVIDDER